MNNEQHSKSMSIYIGLLLLSIATLTSEMLMIRMNSLVFFYIVSYSVIGFALQ